MTLGSLKVIHRSMLSWNSLQDREKLDAPLHSDSGDAGAWSLTHTTRLMRDDSSVQVHRDGLSQGHEHSRAHLNATHAKLVKYLMLSPLVMPPMSSNQSGCTKWCSVRAILSPLLHQHANA